MRRGIGTNPYALFTLLVALSAFQARADAYVSVSMDGFWPWSVTVAPGEAVIWVVMDDMGPYTVSSPIGAWSPLYLFDQGDATGLRFNETGDYSYYDAFSGNNGMVYVRNSVPNSPPSITITNPAEGAVFTAPATFPFGSDAWDMDDGLMEVDFYVGTNLIDQVYESPYLTMVTNLSAGSYVLMSVAYDYSAAATTNTVNIVVQEGSGSSITLGPPRLVAGQFQLDVAGLTVGQTVVLQSSTTLGASGWTSLQTGTVGATSSTFTTAVLPGSRFFRVLQFP